MARSAARMGDGNGSFKRLCGIASSRHFDGFGSKPVGLAEQDRAAEPALGAFAAKWPSLTH
jgi:hypothetical protein